MIEQERVITTVPKAKAVKPLVEKMITLAKARYAALAPAGGGVPADPGFGEEAVRHAGHAVRPAQRRLHPHRAARIRKGDGAEQAMIELVGSELVKRAADRAKRREERLRAQREGKEPGEEEE